LSPVEALLVLQGRRGTGPGLQKIDAVLPPSFDDDAMAELIDSLSPFAMLGLGDAYLAALRLWQFNRSANLVAQRRLHMVRGLRNKTSTLPGRIEPCTPSDGSCFLAADRLRLQGLSEGPFRAKGDAIETFVAVHAGLMEYPESVNARTGVALFQRGGSPALDEIELSADRITMIDRWAELAGQALFNRERSILANPTLNRRLLDLVRSEHFRDWHAHRAATRLAADEPQFGVRVCVGDRFELWVRSLAAAPWLTHDQRVRLFVSILRNGIDGYSGVGMAESPARGSVVHVRPSDVRTVFKFPAGAGRLAGWLAAGSIELRIDGSSSEIESLAAEVSRRIAEAKDIDAANQLRIWERWLTLSADRARATGNQGSAPSVPASGARSGDGVSG
jgi:hypothetical protein